jgi:hypothetical protein
MKVQACNACGKAIGMGTGVFCRPCRREAEKAPPAVGSTYQAILAARTEKLMEMVEAVADPDVRQCVDEDGQNQAVMVAVAAQQLARAWGVKFAKA